MPNFYLDIETTGLDERKDKIITIQFAELDRNTGARTGMLRILKEWESGEKDVLQKFIAESKIADPTLSRSSLSDTTWSLSTSLSVKGASRTAFRQ